MNSSTPNNKTQRKRLNQVYEMILFSMFGAIMFVSKLLMDMLPNIHLIGMFTILFTVVYRKKALIPIYIFNFIVGIYGGFSLWWIPYLYIWTILWGMTMLLPKNMSNKTGMIVYPIVGAAFGMVYGTLYAPAQALLFHLDFKGMITWIIAGLPYDGLHAAGNFITGFLVVPLAGSLRKLDRIGTKLIN